MKKGLYLAAVLTALVLAAGMLTPALAGRGGAQAAEQPLATVADMVTAKDRLFSDFDGGKEGLTADDKANTVAAAVDGTHGLVYRDDVYGVDLNFDFSSGTDMVLGLRSNRLGSLWDGGKVGYYVLMKQDSSVANLTFWKIDGAGEWNDEQLFGQVDLPKNPFGTAYQHNIKFSAIENEDGKCVISFRLDGIKIFEVTEKTAPLPIANTAFTIGQNGGAPNFSLVPEITEKEPAPRPAPGPTYDEKLIYTQPEKGFDAPGGRQDGISYQRGVITSATGTFAYRDDGAIGSAVLKIQATEGTRMTVALRAQQNGDGYYAEIARGTKTATDPETGEESQTVIGNVTLYKQVSGSKTRLATGTLPNDLFDGKTHTVYVYLAENLEGNYAFAFGDEASDWIWGVDEGEVLTGGYLYFGKVDAADKLALSIITEDPYRSLTVNETVNGGGYYASASAKESETPVFGALRSVDGKLVYRHSDKTVYGFSGSVKLYEGATDFTMTARASGGDAAKGYSIKLTPKTADSMTATFYKNGKQFHETELAGATLYDYAVRGFELQAVNVSASTVQIDLSIDGAKAQALDTSDLLAAEGTDFVWSVAAGSFKLFDSRELDLDPSEADYRVYTSKTLLGYPTLWDYDGNAGSTSSIRGTIDQSKANLNNVNFGKTNVMYHFDMTVDFTGDGWLGIALNANKKDAVWNDGFRSTLILLYNTHADMNRGWPLTGYGSVSYDALAGRKVNLEFGFYELTDANTGHTVTALRFALDGVELFDEVMNDPYTDAGRLMLFNNGTTYTITPTANEVDTLPSLTDGAAAARQDESQMTTKLATDDWAPMMNSPRPIYTPGESAAKFGGNGSFAFGDRVAFSKLGFTFTFDSLSDQQRIDLQFDKSRHDSFDYMPLEANNANYGYGVTIYQGGTIEVFKSSVYSGGQSSLTTIMMFDRFADTGKTLGDGKAHSVTVYQSVNGGALTITVFVDDDEIGYSVTDAAFRTDLTPVDGYLSLTNSPIKTGVTITSMKVQGTLGGEKNLRADYVDFATYYENDGEPYVYFVMNSGSATTKWVEVYGTDASGAYTRLLGTVYAPERRFDLPSDYQGTSVKIVSVGFRSENNVSRELRLVDLYNALALPEGTEVEQIAVKPSSDGAGFVYAGSGTPFMPIGGNYMGLRSGDHSTFDTETSFTEADYDPIKADAMMRDLKAHGGNTLRVFAIGRSSVNPGISGDSAISTDNETYYYKGLWKPYLENMANFLATAQKYGIYVMIGLGDGEMPNNDYYLNLQKGEALNLNSLKLTKTGVDVSTAYVGNLLGYFQTNHPELVKSIFAVEFQNEYALYANSAPFDQTEGVVTLANGKEYDMADKDARQAAADEGTIYYLDKMNEAVKSVNPDVLTCQGSFTLNICLNTDVYGMQNITSGDMRVPSKIDVYLAGGIDFLDLHIYYQSANQASVSQSFAIDLESMNYWKSGTQALLRDKPIFMGEFGPSKSNIGTWEDAHNLWVETVRLAEEAGFRGFAVWTLESHLQKQCYNILSDDGKWDTFDELRALMALKVEGVSAVDVSGYVGGSYSIDVTGTQAGDEITYRVGTDGAWSKDNPAFGAVGVYTVYYRVTRAGYDALEGSATVTVKALDPIAGVTADNVKVSAGSIGKITVTGTLEGDVVKYRVGTDGEWLSENPEFTEEGVYTVFYRVERANSAAFEGSAIVTVEAAKRGGCAGCNSALNGAALGAGLLLLGVAGVLFFARRRG